MRPSFLPEGHLVRNSLLSLLLSEHLSLLWPSNAQGLNVIEASQLNLNGDYKSQALRQ
jgi:hypothetical protein